MILKQGLYGSSGRGVETDACSYFREWCSATYVQQIRRSEYFGARDSPTLKQPFSLLSLHSLQCRRLFIILTLR